MKGGFNFETGECEYSEPMKEPTPRGDERGFAETFLRTVGHYREGLPIATLLPKWAWENWGSGPMPEKFVDWCYQMADLARASSESKRPGFPTTVNYSQAVTLFLGTLKQASTAKMPE